MWIEHVTSVCMQVEFPRYVLKLKGAHLTKNVQPAHNNKKYYKCVDGDAWAAFFILSSP